MEPPFWRGIDLHVAYMLPLGVVPVSFGWWGLAAPLLLPQPYLIERAFRDDPKLGKRPWPYFLANELLVLGVVAPRACARFEALRRLGRV